MNEKRHDSTVRRAARSRRLLSGFLHAARNALQEMQAGMALLRLEAGIRPEAAEILNGIEKPCSHLLGLLSDLQAYSAPLRPVRRSASLAEIWRRAWSRVEARNRQRAPVLRELSDRSEPRVAADALLLTSAFERILDDLVRASPDPVVVELGCSRSELEGHPAVRVALRVPRLELTEEEEQGYFEPFSTCLWAPPGLERAIARRIVEAHRGRAGVTHVAGHGTEVVVLLPGDGRG